MEIEIRRIKPEDNHSMAKVIRSSLEEFGANKPGTVYFDEATDHLSDAFLANNSAYFVCIQNNKLLGGAGVFPTDGLPEKTAELVKMYLRLEARGKGIGGKLMNQCILFAKQSGYKNLYIESMPELSNAVEMYEKFGFEHLQGPLGNSGHFDCTIWMLKKL